MQSNRVTPELVDFLKKELEIHVFISPYVLPSKGEHSSSAWDGLPMRDSLGSSVSSRAAQMHPPDILCPPLALQTRSRRTTRACWRSWASSTSSRRRWPPRAPPSSRPDAPARATCRGSRVRAAHIYILIRQCVMERLLIAHAAVPYIVPVICCLDLEDKLQASEEEKQALATQVNSLLSQVAELSRQVCARTPQPVRLLCVRRSHYAMPDGLCSLLGRLRMAGRDASRPPPQPAAEAGTVRRRHARQGSQRRKVMRRRLTRRL